MDFYLWRVDFFCGGWNFSKSVNVDSTFIREMRVVALYDLHLDKIIFVKDIGLRSARVVKN